MDEFLAFSHPSVEDEALRADKVDVAFMGAFL